MTVYRGDGFSYRGTVKTFSGASDSPDITFSLVSEPDMRPRPRFPTFLALPGPSKNVSPYVFTIFVIWGAKRGQKRVQKETKTDVPATYGKSGFDMLFAMFQPCRTSRQS